MNKLISATAMLMSTLLLTSVVQAEETEVNVIYYAVSKHFQSSSNKTKYNERNNTLGLEIIRGKHGFTIGNYKDSYGTRATYMGGMYLTYSTNNVKLGFIYGAVKGQSYLDNKLLPMVLPYAAFNIDKFGFNVLAMPKFQKGGASVVGLQFKYNFGGKG